MKNWERIRYTVEIIIYQVPLSRTKALHTMDKHSGEHCLLNVAFLNLKTRQFQLVLGKEDVMQDLCRNSP